MKIVRIFLEGFADINSVPDISGKIKPVVIQGYRTKGTIKDCLATEGSFFGMIFGA